MASRRCQVKLARTESRGWVHSVVVATSYRAVLLRGRGGVDQLEVAELPIVNPKPGELRIRVRAAGAGSTDLIMRKGRYPYAPPFPLVPGYEVVGDVDAIGDGVSGFAVGQRVCALVVHGGQAELLVRGPRTSFPCPTGWTTPRSSR